MQQEQEQHWDYYAIKTPMTFVIAFAPSKEPWRGCLKLGSYLRPGVYNRNCWPWLLPARGSHIRSKHDVISEVVTRHIVPSKAAFVLYCNSKSNHVYWCAFCCFVLVTCYNGRVDCNRKWCIPILKSSVESTDVKLKALGGGPDLTCHIILGESKLCASTSYILLEYQDCKFPSQKC